MKFTMEGKLLTGASHMDTPMGFSIPCQDAVLMAPSTSNAWMAVSDGCSGSGLERTEKGAKILLRAALDIHQNTKNRVLPLGEAIWEQAWAQGQEDHLELPDMCATLLTASFEDKFVRLWMFGDGVAIWKYKGQPAQGIILEWAFHRPPFLAYHASPRAWQQLNWICDNEAGRLYEHTQNGVRDRFVSLQDGLDGLQFEVPLEQNGAPLEAIALMSDGVSKIKNQNTWQVMQDLLPSKRISLDTQFKRAQRKWGKHNLPWDDMGIVLARPDIEE